VLPRFVELAMQMTGGTAARLSIFESDSAVFRWMHLCGELATFEGATTPRHYSPCGVTLDKRAPVLCRHPEWAYSWVADANIELPEVLLVPLFVGGEDPVGTLWIASSKYEHFTLECARIASELATFVGVALHVKRGQEKLQQAMEAQETLTREMSHRIKNLFALADSMLRQSASGASTKEELTETLSGRLHALAKAHSFVLRDAASGAAGLSLEERVRWILEPHSRHDGGRIDIDGDHVICSEAAASSIALVLNELATNSVKYGALFVDGGKITITWNVENDRVRMWWAEAGGPEIAPPSRTGFESRLIKMAVVEQLKGDVNLNWLPSGLHCDIDLPLSQFLRATPPKL
jgi:two-component sensor histidine kinase